MAKGKGRSPRTRKSPGDSQRMKRASESRKKLKARVLALEARYSTLESLVNRLVAEVIGDSPQVRTTGPVWLEDHERDLLQRSNKEE